MRAKLKLVKSAPTVEKQRVGGRKSDAAYGRDGQKYLTPDQVVLLVKTARQNTHGLRDALMISLTYHHALRVSELVGMRWNAVDWKRGDIAVNRLKGSKSNRQPLDGNIFNLPHWEMPQSSVVVLGISQTLRSPLAAGSVVRQTSRP
jgi:integrase